MNTRQWHYYEVKCMGPKWMSMATYCESARRDMGGGGLLFTKELCPSVTRLVVTLL